MITEVVEVCPHCECENIFRNWDVKKHGYEATCWNCAHKIMLCDECMHADDNPGRRCDWKGTIINGKTTGHCFRMEERS